MHKIIVTEFHSDSDPSKPQSKIKLIHNEHDSVSIACAFRTMMVTVHTASLAFHCLECNRI